MWFGPPMTAFELSGNDDKVHFDFAAANNLAIITKNPGDFKALHDLDQRHSGILGIYQDNDPSRDMSNADIVRAIKNLEGAAQQGGLPIQGEFQVSTIGGTDEKRRHILPNRHNRNPKPVGKPR